MSDSRTILLFGEIDVTGCPESALVHFGREAYEHYMVAPYVRELMMVRKTDYICWSPGFELLYVAACVLGGGKQVQFEELGSTLFSTIDKFEKLDQQNSNRLQSKLITYAGIEVSTLLIDLAEALHAGIDLVHRNLWQDIPSTHRTIISRSYQSTSYAFETTEELFSWISRARYGIHGVWWSLSGQARQINGAGNQITLFDPDRFDELCANNNIEVTVLKSETFNLGEECFSASWVLVSRLTQAEAALMNALQQELKLTLPPSVCSLSTKEISNRPHQGLHAGFIPIKTGRPFDFSNDHHLKAWREFVRS